MCSVAKQHNIKIIVDVVANHVSIDLNSVSDAVDWLDRWKVTQRDMLRLYDLNTGDLYGEILQDSVSRFYEYSISLP